MNAKATIDADEEALANAYAEHVKHLFEVMYLSYVAAAGDKQREQQADNAFKQGLALARRIRDAARALL